MKVDFFNIKIIDTHENDRVLINENTQINSPKLVWNGSDEKFKNLMSSELHFNFLVEHGGESFYHLFTGSETRYKVLLEGEHDGVVSLLWQGFLLPEQFQEPWDGGNYFVDFISTDGFGRLKQKKMSPNYYVQKKSVLEVVMHCLNLTGLNLKLFFAPSLQNSGFTLNYKDLDVDGSCYVDDGDKMNAYDVLVNLITSLGCRLFQYNGKWCLIGLNRFNEEVISGGSYLYNNLDIFNPLEYLGEDDLVRLRVNPKWESAPIVNVLPYLDKMLVSWDNDSDKYLIPEDAVNVFNDDFVPPTYSKTSFPLKYWEVSSNDSRFIGFTLANFEGNVVSDPGNIFNVKVFPRESKYDELIYGPFVVLSSSIVENRAGILENSFIDKGNYEDNYLSLKQPFFTYEGSSLDEYATLEIEFYINVKLEVGSDDLMSRVNKAIENKEFDSLFNLALYFKEHLTQEEEKKVFALFDDKIPDEFYELEFTVDKVKDLPVVKGSLKIEKFMFLDDGYYNLRLYPFLYHPLLASNLTFTKLGLCLNQVDGELYEFDDESDFTTSKELEVFHSTSRMNLSTRRFVFNQNLQESFDSGGLITTSKEVKIRFYNKVQIYNGVHPWYQNVSIGLFKDDYRKLRDGYKLYRKINGLGGLIEVESSKFNLISSSTGYELRQLAFNAFPDDFLINQSDELFILSSSVSGVVDYVDYWIDKWVRVGVDEKESNTYAKALGLMYKELQKRTFFRVTGIAMSLVWPLDLVLFDYKNANDFFISNLVLDLTEGTSELTCVEIRDFEVDDSPIEDPPSIQIQTVLYSPNALIPSPNWGVRVNYQVFNISLIDAKLELRHLNDSVLNGGVETGYKIEINIDDSDGFKEYYFPSVMEDSKRGWYKVVMHQNGVESNVEYLEVNPIKDIREVKISKKSINNSTKQLVFNVEYIGFIPDSLKIGVKKFKPFIGTPDGIASYTDVDSSLSTHKVTLSEGSYKVWLVADGVESNKISVGFFW
ncbi:conserved protein of unknown function [Tenacibaculum sp. 190524A02b]|uniref:hypothetical protein n=1 Tax=Tenacibaculum vairaonense TaxID=3137860 RepID=UPI0032B2F7A4